MKIIGEKLTEKEMLSVKGGSCMLCHCYDGTGVWYADYEDATGIQHALDVYCEGSDGQCNSSGICG